MPDDPLAGLSLAGFERVHPAEPDAARFCAIGVDVVQRADGARRVPFLAGHRAGVAADADIEIDQQAEPAGRARFRKGRYCTRPPKLLIAGAGARPGGRGMTSNCGAVLPSCADSFSMRTRRSNQAA